MFRFDGNKCYRMPAHFGGGDFDPEAKAIYHDVVTLDFRYTTDGDRLSDYIPEGFELTRPELIVQFQQCRQVDWMAGSYYNLIWVAAPVRFNGKEDRLDGTFALVIWENKTTPILTGREMGLPKIHADIEDLHIMDGTYRTRVSYEGSSFLQMEMSGLQPMADQPVKAMHGDSASFGWRYVQKIGGPGAEVSQPTLFLSRFEPARAWTGNGSIAWTALTWEQNPMQWHIIKALAELPMIRMNSVMMTQGRSILSDSRTRVLK